MENALHLHPTNPEETVRGHRIEPGEIFEEDVVYVYNDPDGTWKRLPDSFAGSAIPRVVRKGSTTVYIRLAKQPVPWKKRWEKLKKWFSDDEASNTA